MEQEKSFQSYYSETNSHCYGCGYSNEAGLHVESYWLDETKGMTQAFFEPKPQHTGGFPGNVYGGLIAAILDCHGNGTAYAAGCAFFQKPLNQPEPFRYVTASLTVNFKKPTPMGIPLQLVAEIKEVTAKKVVMELEVRVNDEATVIGSMVSVMLPH